MPREVLKLQVDVPLVVTLDKGPEGSETEGRGGSVEYQYTVNDDSCVMWLPPAARNELLRSGATRGDRVQIVKSLKGNKATYTAQRLTGQLAFDTPTSGPERHPLREQALAEMRAEVPPAASERARANGAQRPRQTIGIGDTSLRADPLEDMAANCLEQAARANWRAYNTAIASGMQCEPPAWADVRAVALSLFLARTAR